MIKVRTDPNLLDCPIKNKTNAKYKLKNILYTASEFKY